MSFSMAEEKEKEKERKRNRCKLDISFTSSGSLLFGSRLLLVFAAQDCQHTPIVRRGKQQTSESRIAPPMAVDEG